MTSCPSSPPTPFTTRKTNKGGPLTGESTARDVVSRLQAIIGSRVEGLPDGLRVLSQIGIKTGRDGKLSIDSAVLSDKIATNLAGVSDLFNATGGVADTVWDYADQATDAITGSLTYRTKGLGTIVSKIDRRHLEGRGQADQGRDGAEGAVREARGAPQHDLRPEFVPDQPRPARTGNEFADDRAQATFAGKITRGE